MHHAWGSRLKKHYYPLPLLPPLLVILPPFPGDHFLNRFTLLKKKSAPMKFHAMSWKLTDQIALTTNS